MQSLVRPDPQDNKVFEPFAEEVFVAKSEPIEVEAVVRYALPNAMFKLRLDNSDREILGIVSGKMRKHFIRILPGDRVKVELSPVRPDQAADRVPPEVAGDSIQNL